MAVKVGVSGVTTKSVAVAGSTTQVKKIVVGTPVRRVSSAGVQAAATIESVGNVNAANLQDGSTLVYSTAQSQWVATVDLENQNMDGGSF